MSKLTENRLRAIIKEELKDVLGESVVLKFRPRTGTTSTIGTSVTGGGTIEPIGPQIQREREQQIKKQAINSRGTPEHINTLARVILAAENRIMFSHTGESEKDSQIIKDTKKEAYSLGILDKVMAIVKQTMDAQQGIREPHPFDFER